MSSKPNGLIIHSKYNFYLTYNSTNSCFIESRTASTCPNTSLVSRKFWHKSRPRQKHTEQCWAPDWKGRKVKGTETHAELIVLSKAWHKCIDGNNGCTRLQKV